MVASAPEIVPALPLAAMPDYSPEQMNQLIRVIAWYIRQADGVTLGRFSGLYLPGLPTTGANLRAGQVFNNNGILTIVNDDDNYIAGVEAVLGLGALTVVV